MTAAEQHIADIRALVRWWVVAFAAMASTAVAGLSVFEVGSLRPWARAVWLLILVGCFGIATAVLLAVGRVFQLPRDWSELSREEQQRSADFGAGPEQLAVWDRSTTDRHRADEVRQQVVAAVRLADSGTALRRMRALLGAAAATVLVLLVALVVVRDAGREPAGSCTTSLRSCAAPQVERPTPVTVRLNTDGAGSDAGARREVARRLGGPGCRPAGSRPWRPAARWPPRSSSWTCPAARPPGSSWTPPSASPSRERQPPDPNLAVIMHGRPAGRDSPGPLRRRVP